MTGNQHFLTFGTKTDIFAIKVCFTTMFQKREHYTNNIKTTVLIMCVSTCTIGTRVFIMHHPVKLQNDKQLPKANILYILIHQKIQRSYSFDVLLLNFSAYLSLYQKTNILIILLFFYSSFNIWKIIDIIQEELSKIVYLDIRHYYPKNRHFQKKNIYAIFGNFESKSIWSIIPVKQSAFLVILIQNRHS